MSGTQRAMVDGRDEHDDDPIVAEACERVASRAGDVQELARAEIRRLAPLLVATQQKLLVQQVVARLSGLGELDIYLRDPTVDEVMVNSGRDIWVDRDGTLEQVGSLTTGRVEHLIERVLAPIGRRVDRTSPIVDARLPGGARVCAVLPPVAVDGPTLAIRKFSDAARELSAFTDETGIELCHQIIRERCNVLITGATSSGKTSLVGALLATLPDTERLVVIEDTTELALTGIHAVRLEARPASIDGPPPICVADLVAAALRLRPDRIVVGEVRGGEVLALVQAMNTGHDGSLSTCHANGPLDALLRLESLVLQAAPTWPLAAIRQQIMRSLDVIVHVGRGDGTGARTILGISEVAAPGALAPHTSRTADAAATPAVRALCERQRDGSVTRMADLTRGRR